MRCPPRRGLLSSSALHYQICRRWIPEPRKYDATLEILGRRPSAQRASQRAITGSSGRGFILGHLSPIMAFRLPTASSIVIVVAWKEGQIFASHTGHGGSFNLLVLR